MASGRGTRLKKRAGAADVELNADERRAPILENQHRQAVLETRFKRARHFHLQDFPRHRSPIFAFHFARRRAALLPAQMLRRCEEQCPNEHRGRKGTLPASEFAGKFPHGRASFAVRALGIVVTTVRPVSLK